MYKWDEDKNKKNFIRRGLNFADAERVFSGTCATFEDTRFDYGEPHFITFGMLEERMVVIAHTPRGRKTRIISIRKENKCEQKIYKERLKTS